MAKKLLSFVYSYFENPKMYLKQLKEWEKYPKNVRAQIDFFVTDDCSTNFPLRDLPTSKKVKIHRYEITKKVPWNWLACRNLGSKYSKSHWLLLTDIDHLIRPKDAGRLCEFLLTKSLEDHIYLFERKDAPYFTDYKPHNDSFLMTKEMFWKTGGYDEELSGNYGTSGRFRNRAFKTAAGNKRLSIPLIRYSRDVISDASTTIYVRKGKGRNPYSIKLIEAKKEKEGRKNQITTLSFPFKRID